MLEVSADVPEKFLDNSGPAGDLVMPPVYTRMRDAQDRPSDPEGQAGGSAHALLPRPPKRGVIGALPRVIPAESVVRVPARYAIRLNEFGKQRMGVVLDDFLIGRRRSRHRLDHSLQNAGNARAALLALVLVGNGDDFSSQIAPDQRPQRAHRTASGSGEDRAEGFLLLR